jgi:GNAT superfamily N-acetyltransferase
VTATLHVRAAGGDDFIAAARVRARSWRVAYEGLVPRSHLDAMADESSIRAWAQRASTSGISRHHVAVLNSVVVGFTGVGQRTHHRRSQDVGEVFALYADPSVWGLGVGRALMQAALGDLRAHDYRYACLWVLASNARHHVLRKRRLHCDRRAGHVIRRRPARVEVRQTLDPMTVQTSEPAPSARTQAERT